MQEKTTGIVLRSIKYNDSTYIVDIYTKQRGRTSFSVKVSRSRKGSIKPNLLQPLSMLEFEADFRPINNLHTIREAKFYYPFKSISGNPYKSAVGLYLAEILYYSLREETQNTTLFTYLTHSLQWLDESEDNISNFHLVFLIHLLRFLGLYPNTENYRKGDYFDLQNACFTPQPPFHPSFLNPEEASYLLYLMRINYKTMHLYSMTQRVRRRCLSVINEYYRLHLPEFPNLHSLEILSQLFI